MLSDLQTKKLTRYFQVYDVDDDGRIDAADFERILENVRLLYGDDGTSGGADPLREAYMKFWDGLCRAADGDGDGGVSLEEWLAYWQLTLGDDGRYREEVRELTDRLFTIFDLDEDGTIGAAEFIDFHGIFGLPVDLAETVFVELDADGDGMISREELIGASGDFFRSNDPDAPGNFLFGPYGA